MVQMVQRTELNPTDTGGRDVSEDIVKRLRDHVNNRGGPSIQNGAWEMMLEAADFIEQLREALRLTRRAMKEECDFITDELAATSSALRQGGSSSPIRIIKVIVEDQPDGSISVRSDELPGLCLAGHDKTGILVAIEPAVRALLEARGESVGDIRVDADCSAFNLYAVRQGERS